MSKLESDLWRQLVAEAGVHEEDAIARAASVTVKQAEAELTAAGFDVAAERAKASAFLEALENGTLELAPEAEAPPPSAAVAVAQDAPPVRRKRDRPVVLWLAAAATVVVAGGALYAALTQPPTPGPTPRPPVPTTTAPFVPKLPELVAASDLRKQAAAACAAGDWSVCLAKLEQARTSDPDGDNAPSVKKLREQAIAGTLKPKPPAPPPP
jgi:hypothetical protein